MSNSTLTRLTSLGRELDMSPDCFGELRRSESLLDDPEALRARMRDDGYLYLPGCLDRAEVLEVRRSLTDKLEAEGALDPRFPTIEAIAQPGETRYFGHEEMSRGNPRLQQLLYSGRMMDFFAHFLGGAVRHYDFTWLRVVTPGGGTAPHCDIVYMGRGTTSVYTAWTPLGDVPRDVGGLMVLENSHRHERLKAGYGRKDADQWCTNRRPAPQDGPGMGGNIGLGGRLSSDPVSLRAGLGGRWLTADFRMGDLLVFSMFLVHASLDNHSREIRLSSDSRYQLASEPVDERWVGETPIAHGLAAKRGLIC